MSEAKVSSVERRAKAAMKEIAVEVLDTVDRARSAVEGAEKALRRDRCLDAVQAFTAGAQQLGLAEGMTRFLPPAAQRRLVDQAGVERLVERYATVGDALRVCVRPRARRVRGFVRTTGQMRSRRSR
ncbi:MAG: hypothetical protein JSV86_17180 [Gemmatimonadota bacterium]|nr:MAG: hypothetical protein JSV86_17180 [Gemmatimonadota bacterium]